MPPCYAIKVAPELAARAVEHLREPGTRVVLTGDSTAACWSRWRRRGC